MRGVSELIATLVLVGISVAIGVFVFSFLVSQVTTKADTPTRIQVLSKEVSWVTPYSIRVTITYYNPCDKVYTVTPVSAELRVKGSIQASLSFKDAQATVLNPGMTAKQEILIESNTRLSAGVIVIQISVSGGATGYLDKIPVKIE